MISWTYEGQGWHDVWRAVEVRAWIQRHPRRHGGRYVIWVDGVQVGKVDDIDLAKWKVHNMIEGKA